MKLTFENLTAEGYAAFILAIIFTIFAIAGFIVFARHKDLGRVVTLVITLLFPFLAVFCWVYLILNVIKYDSVMSLAISVGAAAGYVLLALCFALILNTCLKNRGPRQPKEKKKHGKENTEENAEENIAPTDEVEEQTITTVQPEQPKQPELLTMKKNLLINHNPIKTLPDATTSVEENMEENSTVEESVNVEESVEEETANENVEEPIENNENENQDDETQE